MKLGLALGSGSARGFAFVPILERLSKEGISFDMVAGTSIGALAAGIYGLNGTLHPMVDVISKFSEMQLYMKLADLRLPVKSVLKGSKIKKFLTKYYFGDKKFDDTIIPIIISATSLNQRKTVHFESGKLIDAVMASSAIPGFLPAYKFQNNQYMDGCLLEPLPVNYLLEKGMDKVIAIDLMDIDQPLSSQNLFNSIATVFAIVINAQLPEFDQKKVFVIKPKFDKDFSESPKFHDWKHYVKAGEIEIEKKIEDIKKWLAHTSF